MKIWTEDVLEVKYLGVSLEKDVNATLCSI
jgi:hypothetical protein